MTDDEGNPKPAGDSRLSKCNSTDDEVPDTFTLPTVDDRFKSEVRDDHATNATLYNTLRAIYRNSELVDVDFMAKEREDGTREKYDVWVTVRNQGVGYPQLPEAVAGMIRHDDIRLTGVNEVRNDKLTVSVQPVEVKVEPVNIPVDAAIRRLRELDRSVTQVDHRKVENSLRAILDVLGTEELSQEANTTVENHVQQIHAEVVDDAEPERIYPTDEGGD